MFINTNSISLGQGDSEDIQDHQVQECKSESKESTKLKTTTAVRHIKSDDEIKWDQDLEILNWDLKYSKNVESFIKKHKRWREGIMMNDSTFLEKW